jgi:hypothetical protein
VNSLKTFLLCFTYLLCLVNVKAQNIVKHFTVEDGLPSNEVYYVYQDDFGYYWFCTDRGISRYNGYEFTNLTTADGLTHSTVFKCFQHWSGDLWFACMDGTVTIYDQKQKKLRPYKHNEWLKSLAPRQLWIKNIGFKKASKEVSFFMVSNQRDSSIHVVDSLDKKRKRSKETFETKSLQTFDNFEVLHMRYVSQRRLWDVLYTYGVPVDRGKIIDLIYANNGLYKINPSFNLIDSKIYVNTGDGVVELKESERPRNILTDASTTSLFIDKSGLIWITTQNNGILVVANGGIENTSLKDVLLKIDKLSIGKAIKDKLVLGVIPGKVLVVDPSTGEVVCKEDNLKFSRVKKFMYNQDSTKVFSSSFGVTFDGDKFISSSTNTSTNRIEPFIVTMKDGSSRGNEYLMPHSGVSLDSYVKGWQSEYGDAFTSWIIANDKLTIMSLFSGGGSETQFYFGRDFIYSNTKSGVYKVYADKRESHLLDLGEQYKSIGVSDIDSLFDLAILATKGHGVLCVKDDSVVSRIDVSSLLISQVINSIYIDRSCHEIWCGTDKGISVFNYFYTDNSLKFSWVKNIRKIDGLISGYINDLEKVGDKMIAIHNQGLSVVPANFTSYPTDLAQVSLLGYVNGDSTYLTNNQEFSYNQNNIEFRYETVTIRHTKDMYRYRLISKGKKESWQLTDNRYVKINNMAPGIYVFEVCARAADSDWGMPSKYSFVIKKRFIDRWWVRVLATALLLGLIYIFYKRRITQINEKGKLELALSQLELKNAQLESAQLRGQMNPHFMFNVLNSIQKMILKEEKENANKLLSRFSKLVRASLKYSRLEFIPLADEIEFLENYISIEGQRYPNRFKYSVDIDSLLDKDDFKVPPLLIQPLCENAIKHAFVDGEGTLYVRLLKKDEKTIIVEVIDNGIGILNKPNKDEGSLGISIIKERLALFENEGYESQLEIVAADEKTKKGTRAILTIPYI